MNKLTLDLDSLAVESFDTGESADGQGTVHGHVKVQNPSLLDQMTLCFQNTCGGASCYTCSICMTVDQMCQQGVEPAFAAFQADTA